jgi:steroid delta-isomerase-like uncharacterized protein
MRDTLKTIGDAFNAHDAAKMASVVTDDVAFVNYGDAATNGKAAFQSGVDQLFQMFPDSKSAANRVFIQGHVAIVEMTWVATMNADVMGIKATKKPVGQLRVNIYFFDDDGRVKEVHEYGDDVGLLVQMQGKKGAPPVPLVPTNPPQVHIAKEDDGDKLANWAKSIDDRFNKDDAKVVGAGMADDVDYWLNATGTPALKGKKEFTKALETFFKTFPDQQWTVTNAWGIDGFGIVEHVMTGTFKGPMGPVRPTGTRVAAWHAIDIMQPNADGKIQHGWGYMNPLEMLSEVGALPKPYGGPPPPPPKK